MSIYSNIADYLDVPIENLGHVMSGTGVIIGALTALWTAIYVTRKYYRAQQREWELHRKQRVTETFRQLHQQLWETPDIVKVRRCIVNDSEYEEYLEPVLVARNASDRNRLSTAENDVIEALDRYLATISRLKMFMDDEHLTKTEVEAWKKLLWQNFGTRTRENRLELAHYIETHWGADLLDQPNFIQRIRQSLTARLSGYLKPAR